MGSGLRLALGLNLLFMASLPLTAVAQKGQGQSAGQTGGAPGGSASQTPYFETEMLAYGGVNQVAQAAAREVCSQLLPNSTVIIFDPTSFQNLQSWQSFSVSATLLDAAYKTLIPPIAKGQPKKPNGPKYFTDSIFGGFSINTGTDLAALLGAVAASTSNNASTFTIQDSTMAVSLAHQFQTIGCNANVIYPPLFGSYANLDTAQTQILNAMDVLNQDRKDIQTQVTFGNSNDPKFLLYNDLNGQYDQLLKSVSGTSSQGSPSSGQGLNGNVQNSNTQNSNTQGASQTVTGSGYSSLVEGSMIASLLNDKNTYILYADVVAAGGTQRDIRNVATLFTGDWISYSGGLIVNVALVRASDTSLLLSDTLRYRTGFTNIKKPRNIRTVERTDAGDNEKALCGLVQDSWPQFQGSWSGSCLPPIGASDPILGFPTSVEGGSVASGNLIFSMEHANSIKITLKSDKPSVAYFNTTNPSASTTINVPSKSTVSFKLQTAPVDRKTDVTIAAYYGHVHLGSADLTVNPETLSSAQVSPSTIAGGQPVRGTVCMAYPVMNATTVSLESDDSNIAQPDSTVVIQARSKCADFSVRTFAQQVSSVATISAIFNGDTEQVTISVEQPLFSVSVNSASVVGGTAIHNAGTVVLSSPAPIGGAKVTLSTSGNTVSVPSSVTVPAGQFQANFDVSTKGVSSDTIVTITADYQGTQMTNLTVTAK